jgi:hypothetical protein
VLRLNFEGPNVEAVDDLVEQVAAIIKEES